MGLEEPALDGYRYVTPLEVTEADFDRQGHLNNASIVRLFNDLRVLYIQEQVGRRWIEYLAAERVTVAARELHVLYESEGLPGERFAGAMRVAQRSGKSGIVEEALVAAPSGRSIARCWVVQLLVQDGRVVDWPEFYWELVAEVEGHAIPERPTGPRPPWGPPAPD